MNDVLQAGATDVHRPLPQIIRLPLEVRLHGRGGQGGVTCAKLIAALFTEMGLRVQAFGDYGSERAGAPVQAFTRADRVPIANRNKVYRPNHLIVLDEGLLGPQILAGVDQGALLLLNTHAPIDAYAGRYAQFRFGVVDATAIAREHGIGSASVVIINTTILGAYARMLGIETRDLEIVYRSLGLEGDIEAAEHAYGAVQWQEAKPGSPAVLKAPTTVPDVLPVEAHMHDVPATLKTGTWSNLAPRYREQPAPCNVACPAGNDVVGFIQALKSSGVDAAAQVLLRTQPLPSVCGRVCPAPCMAHCNRAAFDGTVNIRGLERWIGDHSQVEPPRPPAGTARSIVVVGGGPAGLSAAYQLALAGHKVSLLEAAPALGGVLRNGIPAFRLPEEPLARDIARVTRLGVDVRCNARVDGAALAALREQFDAVIVCVGFGASTGLTVSGTELEGVEQGLDFLDRARAGDARLQGHVIVVGGGNTAIDCVRSALRCGAASVRLVYRRARDDMPAIAEEIVEAEREGMRLMCYRQPVAFTGEGRVSAAVLAEVEPGTLDASGRRRPVVTDRTTTVPCDHVLLALGQSTELDLLPADWDKRGDRAWQGDAPLPVWFAGDCGTADGTVTHAIGHGARVAVLALAALAGEPDAAPAAQAQPVAPGQIRFSHYGVTPPHVDRQRPPTASIHDFEETNLGLAGPEEADRCFACGHCTRCDTCLVYCPDGVIYRRDDGGYRIDEDFCKGCGMCVAECPRSAMEMHEKHRAEAAP